VSLAPPGDNEGVPQLRFWWCVVHGCSGAAGRWGCAPSVRRVIARAGFVLPRDAWGHHNNTMVMQSYS
jgi:hypothetical protein